MEAAIAEIKTTELSKLVQNSGLELNEGEQIKQSYLPYFQQLAEIKDQASKINFENPTLLDEKIARELRIRTLKVRTGSETVKDERKKIHALKANLEQSAWNLIRDTCFLEEENFLQVEKRREILEKQRQETLKAERILELEPFKEFVSFDYLDLGVMTDESYQKVFNGAKLQYEAKIEADKKAELDRIAKEKQEAEEREKMRLENERLKKEAEAKQKELEKQKKLADEKLKAEKLAAQKILDEQKAANEKAQKEIQAKNDAIQKEQAEKLRIAKEAQAKVEAELKAKNDSELKAKKEAEEKAAKDLKDKQAAEVKAAKAPKKQKLNTWIDGFVMGSPMGMNEDKTVIDILSKFESFKKWAKSEIEKL